jgi:uncharacterized protein (TIGR02453 family)
LETQLIFAVGFPIIRSLMAIPKIPEFPKAGLQFLKSLKRNNRREWFLKHKPEYEEYVRHPMEAIVDAIAPELERFAPDMQASRKASLFRIYRDTRFSNDKTPYKTHVAAQFPPSGLDRHEGASFYFHIGPGEFLIGGGLYSPDPKDLMAVRDRIAERQRQFESIVTAPGFRRLFGAISGAQLMRVPRNFPKDHPAAEYLRFKQFLASRKFSPETATTAQFGVIVRETFRGLYPFVKFLNEPIRNQKMQRDFREKLLR